MRKSQEELKLFHMSDNEKFMVGNEAMRRWKFITLNTCIRKKERVEVNAKLPPEESGGKERKIELKVSRRKESIKVKSEINNAEPRES